MTAVLQDNTPLTQPPLLQVQGLARRYRNDGGTETAVFENVDSSVARGEFVAIVGDSGVGKSTFLNCLAGLDEWQQGRVEAVDIQKTQTQEMKISGGHRPRRGGAPAPRRPGPCTRPRTRCRRPWAGWTGRPGAGPASVPWQRR